jgi:hypothetical protein
MKYQIVALGAWTAVATTVSAKVSTSEAMIQVRSMQSRCHRRYQDDFRFISRASPVYLFCNLLLKYLSTITRLGAPQRHRQVEAECEGFDFARCIAPPAVDDSCELPDGADQSVVRIDCFGFGTNYGC